MTAGNRGVVMARIDRALIAIGRVAWWLFVILATAGAIHLIQWIMSL